MVIKKVDIDFSSRPLSDDEYVNGFLQQGYITLEDAIKFKIGELSFHKIGMIAHENYCKEMIELQKNNG